MVAGRRHVHHRAGDEFVGQPALEVGRVAGLTARLATRRLLGRGRQRGGGRPERRLPILEAGRQILDLGRQAADHRFQFGDARLELETLGAADRLVHAPDATKPRPIQLRQFSAALVNGYLGFYYPTEDIVRDAYMQARGAREALKAWLDGRVQRILDGKQPGADSTFVYYWLKNGGLGENFRRMDIVFECFHNFLAFSQWGNSVYNVAARLAPTHGDPKVRAWFARTMENAPDKAETTGGFTPLDRFVMELFRTINPNEGSLSRPKRTRQLLAAEL